jgi:hypothetical protein
MSAAHEGRLQAVGKTCTALRRKGSLRGAHRPELRGCNIRHPQRGHRVEAGCHGLTKWTGREASAVAGVARPLPHGTRDCAVELTCRQLTEWYLRRIEAYDRGGPALNSVITVSPTAPEEADALDAALARGGLTGPLHGILSW